jgi:hypothetical protein
MVDPTPSSTVVSLRSFLAALLPVPRSSSAVVYVACNVPPAVGEGPGSWTETASANVEDAATFVGQNAGLGETYVSLACFEPEHGRKKAAITARDWLSADVDDKVMPGASSHERHENARRLTATIPCDHILVDSGGGFHVHLRLPQGQRIQDHANRPDGIRHLEILGRALRLFLERKHADLFGATEPRVRLDHCHGVERVWRIPPGVNCKVVGKQRTLSSDPSTWRPVVLVSPPRPEEIERISADDLSFLDPFLDASRHEMDPSAERGIASDEDAGADLPFDPSVLPPNLQKKWPMLDGDQSGHDFAVATALARLGVTPGAAAAALRARRSLLPDAENRAKAGRSDYITKTVEKAFGAVAAITTPPMRLASLPPYRPFPVETLPEPVRSFVFESAIALGCDPSYIALPLLATLAAAIGNSRRISPKRGWSEPSVLWTSIVGYSGTLKSPAIDLAAAFLKRRQTEALRVHDSKMAEYKTAMAQYEVSYSAWKKRGEGPPPKEPDKPVALRLYCSDITVEALADRLKDAPRGLLLIRDELAGWLKSFDAYRQGRGGDEARWLEMHRAGMLVVDRKSGTTLVHVPNAAVSITGGIQPDALRSSLGAEHFSNGLAARLLLVMPPRTPRKWSDAEVRPELFARVDQIFERLLALECPEGAPDLLTFTDAGRMSFIAFYNMHAKEQNEIESDLAAAWSKLEGYAARLALIIHLVRTAAKDATVRSPNHVDEQSVAAAVELVRWFKHETERVYAVLGDSPASRSRRELVELIESRGGEITSRLLMRACRRFRASVELANQALGDLVSAGLGQWIEVAASEDGGRPTRKFRLLPRPPDDPNGNGHGTDPIFGATPVAVPSLAENTVPHPSGSSVRTPGDVVESVPDNDALDGDASSLAPQAPARDGNGTIGVPGSCTVASSDQLPVQADPLRRSSAAPFAKNSTSSNLQRSDNVQQPVTPLGAMPPSLAAGQQSIGDLLSQQFRKAGESESNQGTTRSIDGDPQGIAS